MAIDVAGGGGGGGARLPTSASSDSTFLNQGAEDVGADRAPSPHPFQDPLCRHNNISIATGDTKQSLLTSSPRASKKKARPHSELFEPDALKNSIIRRSEQTSL